VSKKYDKAAKREAAADARRYRLRWRARRDKPMRFDRFGVPDTSDALYHYQAYMCGGRNVR
jgi:hypothetical protein